VHAAYGTVAAHFLKRVISRYHTSDWQFAPKCSDTLDLTPQIKLGFEQPIAGGAIRAAFIGKAHAVKRLDGFTPRRSLFDAFGIG
jgi:hypothetical protein